MNVCAYACTNASAYTSTDAHDCTRTNASTCTSADVRMRQRQLLRPRRHQGQRTVELAS